MAPEGQLSNVDGQKGRWAFSLQVVHVCIIIIVLCVIVLHAYVGIISVRGRGGDRKERGRADDEDAVMEMDIDPGAGTGHANISLQCLIYYYIQSYAILQCCRSLIFCACVLEKITDQVCCYKQYALMFQAKIERINFSRCQSD